MDRGLRAAPAIPAKSWANPLTNPLASRDAGFSLIELTVVVAVMAVLAVGVTLIPGTQGRDLGGATDMARFRTAFDTTRGLAIAGRETLGLAVTPQGLAQARLGPGGWNRGRIRRWRDRVALAGEGQRSDWAAPEIRLLPDGRSDAFSITFAAAGRCESDGVTGLTCRES